MSQKLAAIFQPNNDLSQAQKDQIALIRDRATELAKAFYPTDSREKSLAMTKLEEAVMWANKGVAS